MNREDEERLGINEVVGYLAAAGEIRPCASDLLHVRVLGLAGCWVNENLVAPYKRRVEVFEKCQ